MKTPRSSPLLTGVLLAALVAAPAALAADRLPLVLAPGAKQEVSLSGQSTLHPFTSRSTMFALVGELEAAAADAGNATIAGAIERGAASVDVKIPVKSLQSGNRDLDAMMQKTLKASQFPIIRFQLKTTRATPDGAGTWAVKARGLLTVAGVDREVALDGRVVLRGGRLVLSGETDVRMTDFGITPPSFLFGAMKTADELHLTFGVTLDTPVHAVN